MSLDLEVSFRGRKTRNETPLVVSVADLTREDVQDFDHGAVRTQTNQIKRIQVRHHQLARLIAQGHKGADAARIVGVTPQSVVILKQDPTFVELVSHYQRGLSDAYMSFHQRLAGVAEEAVGILHDRLEDAPEDFDNDQLLDIVTKTADRTGFGPSSSTNVNVNVGMASRLAEARKRINGSFEVIPHE